MAYTTLTDSKGIAVAARYDRKRNKILISPDGMAQAYARDKSGTFTNLDAFAAGVLEEQAQEAAVAVATPAPTQEDVRGDEAGLKTRFTQPQPETPALSVAPITPEEHRDGDERTAIERDYDVSVRSAVYDRVLAKPIENFLTGGDGFTAKIFGDEERNLLRARWHELRGIFISDPEAFLDDANLKSLLPATVTPKARELLRTNIAKAIATEKEVQDLNFPHRSTPKTAQQMTLDLPGDPDIPMSLGELAPESTIPERLFGISDPLHRLLMHLSNDHQAKNVRTVEQGKLWMRDTGYNNLKLSSAAGNVLSVDTLKAITVLLDQSENLEEYPDMAAIKANPKLVTFTKVRPLVINGVQQFKVVMNEANEAVFVPLNEPVDPVHISQALEAYDAAAAKDKKLVPWRTVFKEMRAHFRTMQNETNESMDAFRRPDQEHYIEYREKYVTHTFKQFQAMRIDEKALATAILHKFLQDHNLTTAELYAPNNKDLFREYKLEELAAIERATQHQTQLAEASVRDRMAQVGVNEGGEPDMVLGEIDRLRRKTAMPIDEPSLRLAFRNKYARDNGAKAITTPEYQAQEDRFIAAQIKNQRQAAAELADAGKQRMQEETGRAYGRTFETYYDAAEHGYVPDTWLSVDLINRWQRNVSGLEKSKLFLTALAATQTKDGMSAAVFMRDKSMAGRTSILNTDSAFQQLENLLNMIKLHVDPGVDFKIYRDADPWEQINTLYNEASMDSNMRKLGFVEARFPDERLNFSRIWVQEGAPQKLLMHLASRGYWDLDHRGGLWKAVGKTMRAINTFNAFTKHIALTVSFFHHFAQFESFVGGTGAAWVVNPNAWKRLRAGFKEARDQLTGNPEAIGEWVRAGMEVSTSTELPDQDSGPLDNALKWMQNLAGKHFLTKHTAGKTLESIRHLKALNDHFLWDYLQPTLKLQLANQLLIEGSLNHPEVSPTAMKRDIANLVNDLYGGQNWVEHLWATPFARDVMRSFVFAPDWSVSSINSARLSETMEHVTQTKLPLSKPVSSAFPNQLLLHRYWPTFMFIILFGLPNLIQFLLYLANRTYKNPDKDMKPFAFMNEAGKEFHVDITSPLQQLGLAKFPPTRGRRVYVQWGKQGLELLRWFEDPKKSYLGKSSTVVKAALEQLVGVNTAGWDMPWKDITPGTQTADRFGFTNVGGDITKGRIYGLARYAMPLTMVNLLDKRPVTFFASTSLGQSQHQATDQLMTAFGLYAEDNAWDRISGVPHRVKNLEDLVPDIIDGLEKNGYHSKIKAIVGGAAGKVRARYNFEIANELQEHPDKPDEERLANILAKLIRIDGTVDKLQKSLDISMKDSAKTFTAAERKAQRDALRSAWVSVLRNRRKAY